MTAARDAVLFGVAVTAPIGAAAFHDHAKLLPACARGGAALGDRLGVGHLLIFGDRPADARRAVGGIDGDREALVVEGGDDLAERLRAAADAPTDFWQPAIAPLRAVSMSGAFS